ncbi:potassium voltage-gated channel subfamily A member 2-like isoform X3 [Bolinopsis microptera]|uniref:potassium voltage-gated channel subfamily A member 2-like isoform X3 n=1 Tax=Bolinopsis microptera TaxID=2820187 RepID=UPI0030793148
MANSVPPREERDTLHQLNRITTCKSIPTNKTPRSESGDTLHQLKRITTCKTIPTNKTPQQSAGDTLHQLKRIATCKSIPTNKTKNLHRSKTGALTVSGRSCTKQDLARERSFSMPKEEEALTQVINFVSKRFVNTHQGVLPQKQQKRRDQQSADNTNDYVKINISGVTFKTKLETLQRYPQTLLGNHADRAKYFDERNGELFFDRHSPTFPSILYFYQSNGRLHKPLTVNMTLFKEELTFFKIKYEGLLEEVVPIHHRANRWSLAAAAAAAGPGPEGVTPNSVDPINSNPAYQFSTAKDKPMARNGSGQFNTRRRETVSTIDSHAVHKLGNAPMSQTSSRQSVTSTPMVRKDSNMSNQEAEKVMFSPLPDDTKPPYQYHTRLKSLQSRIYDLLENPETSLAAKIFSWVSMILIVFSVGTFIAETMPEYKDDLRRPWQETTTGIFFFSFETCCIIFFTIELLGRFTTCPKKKKFARNKLNIIDLISIVPYYIELIIPKKEDANGDLNSIGSLVILRVLRLFRVLRIFKLSRHSKNMIAFGIALRSSLAELLSLGLFLSIDVVVFASALYYCEMDPDAENPTTKFDSIPASCWWAVVTVTTLGYGDMYPETPLGKVLGTFCVFSGILVIAFQMPIMVAKFTWTFMQNTNGSEEEDEEDEDPDLYDELDEDKFLEEEEEGLLKPANGGTKELSAA